MTIRLHPTVYCDDCGRRYPDEFSIDDRPQRIRKVIKAEGWRLARDKEGGGFMDLCPRCR